MDPTTMTNAQLGEAVTAVIKDIANFNKREMGVTCLVFIHREGDEPKFRMVGDSLVYARGDRPVTLSKLNHEDLTAILHQLNQYNERIRTGRRAATK